MHGLTLSPAVRVVEARGGATGVIRRFSVVGRVVGRWHDE
jgi:hypothetical protein